MERRNPEKTASKLEFFTLELKQGLDSVCRFNCRIYLEGVDKTYIHQQYDQLLNDQLWTYAQCCCWTDLKFFLGEKVFNAHKFVIYTQSSRLVAEFGQGDSLRLSSEDLDPETFKCFRHFLDVGRQIWSRDTLKILPDRSREVDNRDVSQAFHVHRTFRNWHDDETFRIRLETYVSNAIKFLI
jgi:hypothetical protein